MLSNLMDGRMLIDFARLRRVAAPRLSVTGRRMVGMDAGTVVALVCGLVLGLAFGALAGLLLTRARTRG